MQKKDFNFASADGRTQIHAVKWLPDDGNYKAILQITHGMIEFIERYEKFARFMVGNGYMIVGHDHIGHGQSVVSRKELGYFTEDGQSDVLVEDMHRLRTLVQGENTGVPYFMFAHSMGSYLLRKYLTVHGDNLRGAIICGTGYIPEKTTALGLKVVDFLGKVKGWHYVSRMVEKLSFGKPYKKFDMTGKNPANSWLTRDEEIVRWYYANPLCTFKFTVSGYKGLMETVQYDCRQENVDKIPKKLPVFIISGSDDPVGDLGIGVKKVYDMIKASGNQDVTYKLYDGYRHEILNEIGKEKVYNDILAWTNVRIET